MIKDKRNSNRIGAVIVGYNPEINRLKSIVEQLQSADIIVGVYRNSNFEVNGDYVLGSGENVGIARAQNLVIQELNKNGDIECIITLDQDTSVSIQGIFELYNELQRLNIADNNIVGIVPSLLNEREGYIYNEEVTIRRLSNNIEVMREFTSSGFLCFTEIYRSIALYNETLFIDYVDYDLAWRLTEKGLGVVRTNRVVFEHNLGEGDLKILSRKYSTPSPFRQYYQVRNIFILWNENYVPLGWKLNQIKNLILRFVFWTLFSSRRYEYVKYMKAGVKDGIVIMNSK